MSSHKILKIRNNEVAIHFSSESGIQFVLGEGDLKQIEIARAFALCYAMTSMPRIYEMFRQILRNDLIEQKKEVEDIKKRIKMQELIKLLTVEGDELEEESTASASENIKVVYNDEENKE